jgi:G:T/U-mismatch repair DNA glycosylase
VRWLWRRRRYGPQREVSPERCFFFCLPGPVSVNVTCCGQNDEEALLEAYYDLAVYWERHEEAETVTTNLRLATDLIATMRGGKANMVVVDVSPLSRVLEMRGRLSNVQEIYSDVLREKIHAVGEHSEE